MQFGFNHRSKNSGYVSHRCPSAYKVLNRLDHRIPPREKYLEPQPARTFTPPCETCRLMGNDPRATVEEMNRYLQDFFKGRRVALAAPSLGPMLVVFPARPEYALPTASTPARSPEKPARERRDTSEMRPWHVWGHTRGSLGRLRGEQLGACHFMLVGFGQSSGQEVTMLD